MNFINFNCIVGAEEGRKSKEESQGVIGVSAASGEKGSTIGRSPIKARRLKSCFDHLQSLDSVVIGPPSETIWTREVITMW